MKALLGPYLVETYYRKKLIETATHKTLKEARKYVKQLPRKHGYAYRILIAGREVAE